MFSVVQRILRSNRAREGCRPAAPFFLRTRPRPHNHQCPSDVAAYRCSYEEIERDSIDALMLTPARIPLWNFLVPRNGVSDGVRLFDFDGWRIGIGSGDLACMIAMHLYPERRRSVEGRLLDCYHRALIRYGVMDYDRQALDNDYRWWVLWHISRPVWQWSAHIPPVVWWNNLERIFLAFADLGCRELLD